MHGNSQHTSCSPGCSGRRRGLVHLEHYRQHGDSLTVVYGCVEIGSDSQQRAISLSLVPGLLVRHDLPSRLRCRLALLFSACDARRRPGHGADDRAVGRLRGRVSHEPDNRLVGSDKPLLPALVDARPLAGSDHGVAGGRLALQRLARFPFLRDGSCSRICFVITRADSSGAIMTRWRRAGRD